LLVSANPIGELFSRRVDGAERISAMKAAVRLVIMQLLLAALLGLFSVYTGCTQAKSRSHSQVSAAAAVHVNGQSSMVN
jgi:hypothetical protein